MERVEKRKERGILNHMLPAFFIIGIAFALVIITYGLDSIVPGIHDAFHDFRHVIGIPCH